MPANSLAMKIRSLVINLVVLSISAAVALVGAEFVVRAVAPQKLYRFPAHMFVNHHSAQYSLAPNFDEIAKTTEYRTRILTNSLGIRSSREFEPLAPSATRIVAIGDSFTMGVGVDEEASFVHLVESELSDLESAQTVEVVNLGVPGYSTAQQIALLKDVGLALNPDLVLLNFYVGNDITQNISAGEVHVVDGYLRGKNREDGLLPAAVRDFFQMNSHLYQMVWPIQRAIMDPEFAERTRRSRERSFSIYDTNMTLDDELWVHTKDRIEELRLLSDQHGFELAVVIIPEDIQVKRVVWEVVADELASPNSAYEIRYPAEQVGLICDSLGIPYLDLLPALSTESQDELLYFPIDGHWNVRGNIVAARAAAQFIENSQFTGQ